MTEERLATSLYIINKAAKLFPIARRLLKKRLFENDYEFKCSEQALEQAGEIADELAKSVGLDELNDLRFDQFGISERGYEEMKRDAAWSIDIEFIDDMEDTDEAENAKEDIEDSLTSTFFSESDFDKYADILTEDSMESLRYEAEERKEAMDFFGCVSRLHEMLSSTRNAQSNLYSLKEVAIKRLGLEPVEYHQNKDDSDNILVFYRYGGFSFHLMISRDQMEKTTCLEGLKRIENVSPEMRLNPEKTISIFEAIENVLQYLGIDTDKRDDIICGGYDACEELGIEKNEVYRRSSEADSYYEDYYIEEDDIYDDEPDEDYQ